MFTERAGLGSVPRGEDVIRPGDSYQEVVRKNSRARFETLVQPVIQEPESSGGDPIPQKKVLSTYEMEMMRFNQGLLEEDTDRVRPLLK